MERDGPRLEAPLKPSFLEAKTLLPTNMAL